MSKPFFEVLLKNKAVDSKTCIHKNRGRSYWTNNTPTEFVLPGRQSVWIIFCL